MVNTILFYKEYWISRNELNYNEEQQRNRVMEWDKEVKSDVGENELFAVQTFARRNVINV